MADPQVEDEIAQLIQGLGQPGHVNGNWQSPAAPDDTMNQYLKMLDTMPLEAKRQMGLDTLKSEMWRHLGVDQATGPYNDGPTGAEQQRRAGNPENPSVDRLRRNYREFDDNLNRDGDTLYQQPLMQSQSQAAISPEDAMVTALLSGTPGMRPNLT